MQTITGRPGLRVRADRPLPAALNFVLKSPAEPGDAMPWWPP